MIDSGSFWAEEIRHELPADQAEELIRGIDAIMPWFSENGLDWRKVASSSAVSIKDSRRELEKLRGQTQRVIETLRSLSKNSHGHLTWAKFDADEIEDNLAKGDLSSAVHNVFNPVEFADDFRRQAGEFLSDIDAAIESVKTTPGNPSNKHRDFLVLELKRVFLDMTPPVEVSHLESSLFFRVALQFLEDLEVDPGNLARSIKRLNLRQ